MKKENISGKALNLGTLGLNSFMVLLNLGQWFLVEVINWTEVYSFGEQATGPYFYKSAALFAMVHLYWGLLFLAMLILSISTVLFKKKILIRIALLLNLLFVAAYIYHGTIGG
tara:strand:- start:120 stop:458 length:339 start_codon:yes stop_codon:yes gene_type:complete